jgi:hypothetical protein
MKFVITGEHWGDPASFRLNFKIKNDDNANPLQLAGGSHVLFEEVRLMASGTEIERITNYGRIHELFRSVLMSSDFNANEAVEDGRTVDATLNPPTKAKKIGKGQYLSVSMQPLLGFLASGKYVPLRYCPLELTFTLASADDALDLVDKSPSRAYSIRQAEMRYSVVRLDSALESGFASMLLQQRALQLSYRTLLNFTSTIPAGANTHQASVVRALSRIAGVFITFVDGDGVDAANRVVTKFVNPSRTIALSAGEAEPDYGIERDLKIALTLGSKQWPEMSPASSQSELFSLLRQAVNIYDTGVPTLAINSAGYSSDKFCAGIPTAIIPGQPFSSVSSRSGEARILQK